MWVCIFVVSCFIWLKKFWDLILVCKLVIWVRWGLCILFVIWLVNLLLWCWGIVMECARFCWWVLLFLLVVMWFLVLLIIIGFCFVLCVWMVLFKWLVGLWWWVLLDSGLSGVSGEFWWGFGGFVINWVGWWPICGLCFGWFGKVLKVCSWWFWWCFLVCGFLCIFFSGIGLKMWGCCLLKMNWWWKEI